MDERELESDVYKCLMLNVECLMRLFLMSKIFHPNWNNFSILYFQFLQGFPKLSFYLNHNPTLSIKIKHLTNRISQTHERNDQTIQSDSVFSGMEKKAQF